MIEKNYEDLVEFTQKRVVKVYPAAWRINSSNLTANVFWSAGIQVAALNFQTADIYTFINQMMFK